MLIGIAWALAIMMFTVLGVGIYSAFKPDTYAVDWPEFFKASICAAIFGGSVGFLITGGI